MPGILACVRILAALLALPALAAPVLAGAATLTLTSPSDLSGGVVQLAPLRDFVVQGTLFGLNGVPANVQVTLTDSSGTVVRTVTSAVSPAGHTDPADIDLAGVAGSYGPRWTTDRAALCDNPSPDLVTGLYSANKAVVNSAGRYAALVLGGAASGSGITESGPALTAGVYTLTVRALDFSSSVLASASQTLTIAPSDMLAGRFSPTAADGYPHFENMIAFARDNGLKIMLDPFPGYWSQGATPASAPVFYEHLKLWRVNDLAEYLVAPRTIVVIYNVTATSATQGVEIGGLIYNNRLQDATPGHSVSFYRYDIGDTSVITTRSDGTRVTRAGSLVPFDGTTRSSGYSQLALTRAERRAAGAVTAENRSDPADAHKTIDANVADGVYLKPGQTLSLLGAVTPIGTAADVSYAPASELYTVNRRIERIRYTITAPDGTVATRVRAVALTRDYAPGWTSTSIYEYKNDFAGDFTQEGAYSITAQGLDSAGQAVANAAQTFALIVSRTGLLAPAGTVFSANQLRVGGAMLDLQLDEALDSQDPRWLAYSAASGTAAAGRVIDSLSGLARADSLRLPLHPAAYALGRLHGRAAGNGLWTQGFYAAGGTRGYDTAGGGLALGFDARLAEVLTAGIMLTAGHSRLNRTDGDRVKAEDWQLGLYGTLALPGGCAARAWLGYGRQDYTLTRHPLGLLTLDSAYQGHSTTAALELAKELSCAPGLRLTPVLGLHYGKIRQDGFREDGDPLIGLRFDKAAYTETEAYLGAHARLELPRAALRASVLYRRQTGGDTAPQMTARFNGGGPAFALTGTRLPRNACTLSAGWEYALTPNGAQKLALEYRGDFHGESSRHQGILSYILRF